jgi:hypothetical protein
MRRSSGLSTVGEYFGLPGFTKRASAAPASPADVLAELAKLKAERNTRLRRATHLIKAGSVGQDARDEWVRANPREAQRLTVREIDERIVKASRESDRVLNAEIDRLEMEVARWPSDLARMHKAEQIAAHLKTPESVAARERLDKLRKQRDAILDANPAGFDLTPAERRSRKKLSHAIMDAEIEAFEPRFRADREIA